MVTTRLSERGQVVIPKAIRDKLGLKRGQTLEVDEVDGTIRLRPAERRNVRIPRNWKEWGGTLKGTNALQELEEEHRREIESGR